MEFTLVTDGLKSDEAHAVVHWCESEFLGTGLLSICRITDPGHDSLGHEVVLTIIGGVRVAYATLVFGGTAAKYAGAVFDTVVTWVLVADFTLIHQTPVVAIQWICIKCQLIEIRDAVSVTVLIPVGGVSDGRWI